MKKKIPVLLQYTLLFALAAVVIFSSQIVQKKSLVAYNDCYNESYPALQYVAKAIKTGHLDRYDNSIGLGDDVIGALSWYGFGDILWLPSAFFSPMAMVYCYTMIAVMKMWLAGLFFMLYLRYKKCDSSLIVAGGIGYGLCFYMLQIGLSSFEFVTAPVYFPLLILGIDKIYRDKENKWIIILALVVFIQALNGFYFLFDDSVACGVYCLFLAGRDVCRRTGVKEWLGSLGKIALAYVLGVILASPVLLRVIEHFLQSSRSNEPTGFMYKFFALPSASDLIIRLKNLVFPAYSLYEYGLGIQLLSVAIIVFLLNNLKNRKYHPYLLLISVLLLGYIFPGVGTMMNGFAYDTSRWLYIAHFAIMAVTVSLIPDFLEDKRSQWASIIAVAVLMIVYIPIGDGSWIKVLFRMLMMTAGGLLIAYTVYSRKMTFIALGIIFNTVLVGFLFNAPVAVGGLGAAGSYMRYAEVNDSVFDSMLYKLASDDDKAQYHRVDFNDTSYDAAAFMDINTTFTYYSISNGNILGLFEKLRVSPAIFNSYDIHGLDSRQVLESLFSTRVYTESYLEQSPVNNDYFLPQGLFYSKAVAASEAEELDYLQRMNILMDALVIESEDVNEKVGISDLDIGTQKDIDFELSYGDGIEYSDGCIKADKEATMTVSFDPIVLKKPSEELYLQIDNLTSDTDTWSDIILAGRSIRTRPKKEEYYLNGNYDYLVNVSSVAGEGKLILEFQHGGIFKFDDIRLICNSNDGFEKNFAERSIQVLTEASNDDGHISGRLDTENAGYIMINLPYSPRWKCYVDGVRSEVVRANWSFMAAHVDPGEHHVEFRYE